MAEKLDKWEKFDKLRVQNALEEIEASPNLRFYIRQLLGATTVEPFVASNQNETAYHCGINYVHQQLEQFLSVNGPDLKHLLEKEEYNENVQRLQSSDPDMGNAQRGDTDTGNTSGYGNSSDQY